MRRQKWPVHKVEVIHDPKKCQWKHYLGDDGVHVYYASCDGGVDFMPYDQKHKVCHICEKDIQIVHSEKVKVAPNWGQF